MQCRRGRGPLSEGPSQESGDRVVSQVGAVLCLSCKSPLGFPWWEAILWARWPFLLRLSQHPQLVTVAPRCRGLVPCQGFVEAGAPWGPGVCVFAHGPHPARSARPQEGTRCGHLVAGACPGLSSLGAAALPVWEGLSSLESSERLGAGQTEQGQEKIPEGQK